MSPAAKLAIGVAVGFGAYAVWSARREDLPPDGQSTGTPTSDITDPLGVVDANGDELTGIHGDPSPGEVESPPPSVESVLIAQAEERYGTSDRSNRQSIRQGRHGETSKVYIYDRTAIGGATVVQSTGINCPQERTRVDGTRFRRNCDGSITEL